MEQLLRQIRDTPDSRDIEALVALVDILRPDHPNDATQANNTVLALSYLLERHPDLQQGLRGYLLRLLATRKQVHLFAETGILGNQGFFSAASQRLGWKILPPAINDQYLRDVFGQVFHRRDDYQWISHLRASTWAALFDALHLHETGTPGALDNTLHEILEAMLVLSHRLSAMGLEPELVRNEPSIEDYESSFLAQNREITEYVAQYRACLLGQRSEHMDEKQGLVLLGHCREVIGRIRRNTGKTGISINATYLLTRIDQTVQRLETLLHLLESEADTRRSAITGLLTELVSADNRKYSLRELFSTTTGLLALQVTEHAGRTGEHYVTTTRAGYFGMARSAMGAGLIVGFMAMLKIFAAQLKLAPFGEAFLFSANYSLGFMLIHVLHFTVATKQPAMTAASIAASIHESREQKGNSNLEDLADLTVSVFRTQFIAILGNVIIAFPVAYGLAWLYYFQSGHHLAAGGKAAHLLQDIDPLHSLAIFHAAIAGVCLFLSGLISGYHDNMAVYNRIPERLRQLRWARRLLGESRLRTLTGYIENNLGALAGNFYFGIMLGSMGTLGFILGLPLDIRHITFSSANFAFALVAEGNRVGWETALLCIFGLIVIGITNLLVSFSLALMVALRSRGVRYRQWLPLALLLLRRLVRHPGRYFLPPARDAATAMTSGLAESDKGEAR
jgi:site-specific recombinase